MTPLAATAAPPPRHRHPEQWLILAVMALILFSGLGWGLPDAARLELLTWGQEITPAQLSRVFKSRDDYYRSLDQRQAQEGRRVLEGQPARLVDPPVAQAVLDPGERDIAWRSYLLGSSAIDERFAYSVLSRMSPAKLDFNPRRHNYGGAFLYPLGALLYAEKALGFLSVPDDLSRYLTHPRQVAHMYMTGRALGVLAFLGILALLGRWGLRLGGRLAGGLAMLTFALSSVAFWQALVTKPHVYAAFFGFWGLYLLDGQHPRPRPWRLAGSVAALGWAMGSALPAGALALAYPIFLYQPGPWRRWLKPCLLAWLGMGLVFLLSNPYALLSPETFAYTLGLHSSGNGLGYGVFSPAKLWDYLQEIFVKSYAFPLGLAGGLAALALAWRGAEGPRRLAWLWLLLTLLVGGTLATPRITLFTGPLLCLLTGLGLARWPGESARLAPAARAGLLGLMLLAPLACLGFMTHELWNDGAWKAPTRAWLAQAEITPQTSFGAFGKPDPTNLPPFPFLDRRVVDLRLYHDPQNPPDYVILGHYQHDPANWATHPLHPRYHLVAELGYVPTWDWLAWMRQPSESRLAAWVYRLGP